MRNVFLVGLFGRGKGSVKDDDKTNKTCTLNLCSNCCGVVAGILIKEKNPINFPIFLRSGPAGRADLSCKEHVSEEVAQSNTGVGPFSKPDLFVAWKSHILFLP